MFIFSKKFPRQNVYNNLLFLATGPVNPNLYFTIVTLSSDLNNPCNTVSYAAQFESDLDTNLK